MGICDSSNAHRQEERQQPKNAVKVSQLPPEQKALMDCKQCRDKIKGLIKRLERTSQKKRDKAKDLLKNKDKDRARIYLKQSKFHSDQLKVYDGQLEMIETQISQLETSMQMAECLKVLENGNTVLKKMQEEINIEKWEQVTDDMKELKAQQDEIGEFLKQQNINEEEFEGEVDDEIKKMEKEIFSSNDLNLPSAPKDEVHIKEQDKQIKEKKKVAVAV